MPVLRVKVGSLSEEDLQHMIGLAETYKQMQVRRDGLLGEGEKVSFPYLHQFFFQLEEALKEEHALRQNGSRQSRTLTIHYQPGRLNAIPRAVRQKLVQTWKDDLDQCEKEPLRTLSGPLWDLLRKPRDRS